MLEQLREGPRTPGGEAVLGRACSRGSRVLLGGHPGEASAVLVLLARAAGPEL